MTDSYLLIKCDSDDLAPIRRAVHAVYDATDIKASEVVYTEGRDGRNPYHAAQTYRDRVNMLSQIIQSDMEIARKIKADRAEHRQVMSARCGRCGHWAVSLCPKANMTRFLKRLGWKVHVYSDGRLEPESTLVCQSCAGGGDEPLSVFSPYYGMANNRPAWRKVS